MARASVAAAELPSALPSEAPALAAQAWARALEVAREREQGWAPEREAQPLQRVERPALKVLVQPALPPLVRQPCSS